jgi:hypothetical protein
MEHAVREDLEAYALGVLEPDERGRVASHVARCAECREIVDEHERSLAVFPAALAAAGPSALSPAVRDRVMRMASRRLIGSRIAATLAVAAALLVVVAVAWNVQLTQTLAQERELYRRLAGEQEIVFEVVDSPRTAKIFLRPPVSGSTAYGKVFVRPDLPFVVAMAGRLAAPPQGQTYHVWLTLDTGETLLAGTLGVNADGFGSLVYEADQSGVAIASARVTLQPMGATAPEGVPVVFGSR